MVLKKLSGFVVFLFSYRRRVYLLRKRYDRIREKADKERNSEKRLSALRILDHVEPTLIMLEEQNVSRFERGRMIRYVKSGIAQAKSSLKGEIRYPIKRR